MKVLVVDDVGYTRHFHVQLLQKLGYHAESAENGRQALRILERDMSIDVVLTDLMMPELDGTELYKRAMRISRVVDRGQAVPPVFILMTVLRPGGSSQQKDLEKLRMAKEIGFVDVLYKPTSPEQLKQTLDNIKFARGARTVDIVGMGHRMEETVGQLISGEDWDAARSFIDHIRGELDRLENALPAVAAANS